MTADELKRLFGVETDEELGEHFGRKGGAVSAWRKSGSVPPGIELKARELLGERNVDLSGHTIPGMKKQRPIELLIEKKLGEKTDQELEEIYFQLLTFERVKGGNASEG